MLILEDQEILVKHKFVEQLVSCTIKLDKSDSVEILMNNAVNLQKLSLDWDDYLSLKALKKVTHSSIQELTLHGMLSEQDIVRIFRNTRVFNFYQLSKTAY
jgi:hypothetical protein